MLLLVLLILVNYLVQWQKSMTAGGYTIPLPQTERRTLKLNVSFHAIGFSTTQKLYDMCKLQLCISTYVRITVLLFMSYLSIQKYNTINYSIKVVHLTINRGKLYNITLLIIYFKVHRFPLSYNNALKIFRRTGGCSASPAPILTVQQSPSTQNFLFLPLLTLNRKHYIFLLQQFSNS